MECPSARRFLPRIGRCERHLSNHWKILLIFACLAAAASAPAEDLAVKKAREKAERGVKGRIWAIADDEFVIYVDGKKAASGDLSKPPEAGEVKLKPGDVIAARAVNKEAEYGFGMIFLSNNGKVTFSSNAADWQAYKPSSKTKWWDFDPATVAKAKPAPGSNTTLNHDIETLAEQGCNEIIWGDPAEDVAYLYRVITLEDLIE